MALRTPILSLALLGAVLTPAAPAQAGYAPGESQSACAGAGFGQTVGTSNGDVLRAGDRPERVYGMRGSDRLLGGAVRASCLYGGLDPDLLTLGSGGGIALGEDGADVVVGSDKDDALGGGPGPDILIGGLGDDVLRGDTAIDAFNGGPGDDAMVASDERREVVACGSGDDTVAVDAYDAVIGCERVRVQSGDPLPVRNTLPRRGGRRAIFRFRFRAPAAGRAGTYVVAGARCDKSDAQTLTEVPAPGERVRRGQLIRVGIRPPKGGWCSGSRDVVLARRPACPPTGCFTGLPLEPMAMLRVRVR